MYVLQNQSTEKKDRKIAAVAKIRVW